MSEMVISKRKFSTRDIVLVGLFTALIAVSAFIKIPIGIVPMTLQTLMVVLSALVLGPKLGATAVGVYIAIGLIGIPIFTQGGGIMYVLQPTFGYLIGFFVAAIIIGTIRDRLKKPTYLGYCIAGVAGLIAVYALGVAYFYFIMNVYMGKGMPIQTILVSCCAVFIPSDVISCVVAGVLAKRLNPILHK